MEMDFTVQVGFPFAQSIVVRFQVHIDAENLIMLV